MPSSGAKARTLSGLLFIAFLSASSVGRFLVFRNRPEGTKIPELSKANTPLWHPRLPPAPRPATMEIVVLQANTTGGLAA
jgi:hypothetical protein